MKHTKLQLLMLLMAWLTIGAYAQTNRLYIPDIRMSRGSEGSLSVFMENADEVTAVEFTLEVPSGFTINPAMVILSDRVKDHQITGRTLKNGKYKFVLMSPTNETIKGMAGLLLSMQIKAAETLTDETDYPIVVSDAVMSRKTGENVLQEISSGTITIKSLPNLHVVSLECSDPVADTEMTVTWKVRNDDS